MGRTAREPGRRAGDADGLVADLPRPPHAQAQLVSHGFTHRRSPHQRTADDRPVPDVERQLQLDAHRLCIVPGTGGLRREQ
jgi:hypothetical protein